MRDGAFRSSVIFRPIAFRRHQHAFAAPVAPKLAQETPNWWPLKSAADHFEVFRRSCFSTLENQSLTCRQSENLSTEKTFAPFGNVNIVQGVVPHILGSLPISRVAFLSRAALCRRFRPQRPSPLLRVCKSSDMPTYPGRNLRSLLEPRGYDSNDSTGASGMDRSDVFHTSRSSKTIMGMGSAVPRIRSC